jgi:hypothetical protein
MVLEIVEIIALRPTVKIADEFVAVLPVNELNRLHRRFAKQV